MDNNNKHLHKRLVNLYCGDNQSDPIQRHLDLQEWDLLLADGCPELANRTVLVIRFIYN